MHPWVGPEYSFAVSEAGKPKAVTCQLAPLSLLTISNSHTCVSCIFKNNTSTVSCRLAPTSNSFKFSHLRQLPNLSFAYTYMAMTPTVTNTSRGLNRYMTSKRCNIFGISCNFALSAKTRPSILWVTHQMSRKKRNYSAVPYKMMNYTSRYWVSRGWHYLVIGGVGSL